jgi:hypothetical protein
MMGRGDDAWELKVLGGDVLTGADEAEGGTEAAEGRHQVSPCQRTYDRQGSSISSI